MLGRVRDDTRVEGRLLLLLLLLMLLLM